MIPDGLRQSVAMTGAVLVVHLECFGEELGRWLMEVGVIGIAVTVVLGLEGRNLLEFARLLQDLAFDSCPKT
jgi:hypothetical protein